VDYEPCAKELADSGNLIHAIRMILMFDAALTMLGPDTETLKEILHELGKRHIKYGVSPHFFPFMGQAVVYALSETLGPKAWTTEIQEAWVEVYEVLSGEIMRTILNGTR
jgi:hemoglobin-like flavoprotein